MSLAGKKRKRHSEICQRQKRRKKIVKLKLKLAKAKTDGDRDIIIRKMKKIAPEVQVPK